MDLQGKVINVLGDSITEGAGCSQACNRYTDVLQRMYGCARVNNYGISGSRIARINPPSNERHDRDFCLRATEMDKDADAVVVFGGTNDFGHGDIPFGTMADRTPDTYLGACHHLMTYLLSTYPGKPILFLTPLPRTDPDNPLGDGSKTIPCPPLTAYREGLMQVALCHSIPLLDLYATSGFDATNPVILETLMPDGLHPSDAGHQILARRIGEALRML